MSNAPLDPHKAARRREILASAVRVFERHGFHAARIREIAAGAGVAEGTIYLYFASKDDLLLTIFREHLGRFCNEGMKIVDTERPFAEKLTDFLRLQLQQMQDQPALATVLLIESRQSRRFYGQEVRQVLRTYAETVHALLASGVETGEVRTDLDLPLARRMLIGFLEEVELSWLMGTRSQPLVPEAERVAALYLPTVAASDRLDSQAPEM